jgi:hypothetical protein
MFKRKDYVFLLCRNKFYYDDPDDKKLNKKISDYIQSEIKSVFVKRQLVFLDEYLPDGSLDTYSIMATCDMNKGVKNIALMYEVYAFTKLKDENIFVPYGYSMKEFSDEKQSIKVYKIKI